MKMINRIIYSLVTCLAFSLCSAQWLSNGCLGEKMAVFHYMTIYDFNHTAEMFDNNATVMCEEFLAWGQCLMREKITYEDIHNELQKFIDRNWEDACGDPAKGALHSTTTATTKTTSTTTELPSTTKPPEPIVEQTTRSEMCHLEWFRMLQYDPVFKKSEEHYGKVTMCRDFNNWYDCLKSEGEIKEFKNKFPFEYVDGGWCAECDKDCTRIKDVNANSTENTEQEPFTESGYEHLPDYNTATYSVTPTPEIVSPTPEVNRTCATNSHYEECPRWKDNKCEDVEKGNLDRESVSNDSSKYCSFSGCHCDNGYARNTSDVCVKIGEPNCVLHITIKL